jgi:3-deoxy-D-manno-octulosonate 8-phosphate phosphatase (KDO 8-P phosphatase)
MNNFKKQLIQVKAFTFDVDGVFSTAETYLHPGGDLMRTMNIRDGYALQYAIKKGYPVGIITGGNSESVYKRFRGLGVTDIYLRCMDKKEAFTDFLYKYDLKKEDVLYMGDDLPDIDILNESGVPTCPANAAQEVKAICNYISDFDGGKGCVRDVIEQVLKIQGEWMDAEHIPW